MKNIGTIAAAVFLGLVLLLYMCTFKVRFTEVAIVKTFGKPAQAAIIEPGLKLKWPPPIQTVQTYDKRVRILEDATEEARTIDGKNLVLKTFTLWRIGDQPGDAKTFLTNFPGGEEEGEKKLRTTVVSHKQAIVAKHGFPEFVSVDPRKRKLREIEDEIRVAVADDVRQAYGIEIVGFGIKKLGLPQSVTTEIFASMKANENRKAARYAAEGKARAQDITAEANATEARIMAAASEKVAEIQNEAEKVVSEMYKKFDEHQELRILLDGLRAMERALGSRATLILDSTEFPWDIVTPEGRAKIRPDAATE